MVSNILTMIAYIFMAALIVCIGRQCWKDTKNDFRSLYREARYIIRKKKRAD